MYVCMHDNNDVSHEDNTLSVCVCCIVAECISDFYSQDVCVVHA